MVRRSACALVALAAFVFLLAACRGGTEGASSELRLGGQAYLAQCSICHGVDGQGDGPLAASIVAEHRPEPAKLTERVRSLGRRGVMKTLEGEAHRRPGTPMPLWGPHLGRLWTIRIADYIAQMPRMDASAREAVARYIAPVGTTGEGRRTYVTYCSSCHGPQGEGKPFFTPVLGMVPAALEADALGPMTDEELAKFLGPGGPHMDLAPNVPGWLYTISPSQRAELVAYLRVMRTEPSR